MTRGLLPRLPRVIGGRYGLSSREFTPAMVKAVFDELAQASPKPRFTVGIRDDVTHLSLDLDEEFDIEPPDVVRAVFYGLGSDGTVSSNKASIKIIGEETRPVRTGSLRLRLEKGRLDDGLASAVRTAAHPFVLPDCAGGFRRHPRSGVSRAARRVGEGPRRSHRAGQYADATQRRLGAAAA